MNATTNGFTTVQVITRVQGYPLDQLILVAKRDDGKQFEQPIDSEQDVLGYLERWKAN